MIQIHGTLRKEETREFTKKDGTPCKKRVVYIEPEGSIYPIEISIEDQALKLGNVGDSVSLDICLYPYYFENGQRKKANVSYYVPLKK
jgi:hypothetical protein